MQCSVLYEPTIIYRKYSLFKIEIKVTLQSGVVSQFLLNALVSLTRVQNVLVHKLRSSG